jgi:hypothetical protein
MRRSYLLPGTKRKQAAGTGFSEAEADAVATIVQGYKVVTGDKRNKTQVYFVRRPQRKENR